MFAEIHDFNELEVCLVNLRLLARPPSGDDWHFCATPHDNNCLYGCWYFWVVMITVLAKGEG